jgi:hypothetical protein
MPKHVTEETRNISIASVALPVQKHQAYYRDESFNIGKRQQRDPEADYRLLRERKYMIAIAMPREGENST